MDAANVLRLMGGRASRAELLDHCTRHALTRAIATGTIEKAARGRYVLPSLPSALKLAAAVGGAVSHTSAAQHWDYATLLPSREVHLVVRANAHPTPVDGVVLHYAEPPDGAATDPLRTVLDCAGYLPWSEALAIADSALRSGDLNGRTLVAAAAERQGRGRARMLRVARAASPVAANPFESCLRAIVLGAGVLGFEPQLSIPDSEVPMLVDLGDPDRMIALEADSFEWHGRRKSLNRDCWRYDELVTRGWLVLRFSWEQVMFHPRWVSQMVTLTCVLRDGVRPSGRKK